MTKDPLEDSQCQTPVGTGVFLTSDSTAWLWFSVSGVQKGDRAKAEWFYPDNTLYHTSDWEPITWEGDGCLWSGIYIADSSAVTTRPGTWSVKVSYNGAFQFTETFRILQPAADVKVTVKNRMMTKDGLPNSGCRTPQPASSFLTSDQAAWVWFSFSGSQLGDRVTNEWIAPDNTVYLRFVSGPATWVGDGCYHFRIFIAGWPPATQPGNWKVKIFYNSTELFTESFQILQPSAEKLSAQGCDKESSLKSIEGVSPASIEFVNQTSGAIQIFWLDYNGRRQLYQTLQAGQKYVQETFLTHPWVVTDSEGQCLGIYLPVPGRATALITGQITQPPPDMPQPGYAVLRPNAGQSTPAGSAVFSYTQGNILVTEAGVPSARLTTSARIFADINLPRVNTGAAIANPNDRPASIRVDLVRIDGSAIASTTLPLVPPRGQIARFINEMFQNVPASFTGVLNITSDVPVAAVTLRQSVNERGEALLTTLPVADLKGPVRTEPVCIPHLADGTDITTQFVLINPVGQPISGRIVLFAQDGGPLTLSLGGTTASAFAYTIGPNAALFSETQGIGNVKVGSALIKPDPGNVTPVATAVFRIRAAGTLVTEAGVAAPPLTKSARVFVDVDSRKNTGIAIDNPWDTAISLDFSLRKKDGTSTGDKTRLEIPRGGQIAKFVDDLFPGLALPFQGVLDISGNLGFAAVTLRQTTNERGDLLITTLPVADLTAPSSSDPAIIPHLGVGGGLETEIVFLNSLGASEAGNVDLFKPDGTTLELKLGSRSGTSFPYSLASHGGTRFIFRSGSTIRAYESETNAEGTATFFLDDSSEFQIKTVDADSTNPISGLKAVLYANAGPDGFLVSLDPSGRYTFQLTPIELSAVSQQSSVTDSSTLVAGEGDPSAIVAALNSEGPKEVPVPRPTSSESVVSTFKFSSPISQSIFKSEMQFLYDGVFKKLPAFLRPDEFKFQIKTEDLTFFELQQKLVIDAQGKASEQGADTVVEKFEQWLEKQVPMAAKVKNVREKIDTLLGLGLLGKAADIAEKAQLAANFVTSEAIKCAGYRPSQKFRLRTLEISFLKLKLTQFIFSMEPLEEASGPGCFDFLPGEITGVVVDDTTNEPINGAAVRAGGPAAGDAITSDGGKFKLTGLVAGGYLLSVRNTGYHTAYVNVRVQADQSSPAIIRLKRLGIQRIEITPASPPLLRVGKAQQFSATAFDFAANSVNIKPPLVWNSDNPRAAEIDHLGMATGKAAGRTRVSLFAEGVRSNVVALAVESIGDLRIGVTPGSLSFGAQQSGANPTSQTLSISSTGGAANWTASTDATWLTLSPSNGATPGSITVSVNKTGLTTGTFNATITVTAPEASNGPIRVPVTLNIASVANGIEVNPTTLTFNAQKGSLTPPTQTLNVSSTGGALSWTANANVPWLTLVPNSGTTPSAMKVSADHTGLNAGTYNGAIAITSAQADNSPKQVPVTLLVVDQPTAPLTFTINPNPLPPATVGQRYEFNFCQGARKNEPCGGALNPATSPTGGNPPYHFQLDSGVGFPPFGLVLDINGLLSGTPTIAGPPKTFRVCAVDLSGTQACQNTSLEVKAASGSPLDGNWSGTFRATSPSLCVGTGTWEARDVKVVDGAIVQGTWRTGSDAFEPLRGTFDGQVAKMYAGTGVNRVDLTGTVTGASISGDFAGPECTPVSGLIKGTFSGNKGP